MTQILIHRTAAEIVLATDSRAVAFSAGGEEAPEHLQVRKVFHPVPNVVLVTAGAGYGIWLCEGFGAHLARHGLNDVELAAEAALTFLKPLADALQKKHPPSIDQPHLDRVYVIVAGIHEAEGGEPSVDVRLFASEQTADPLHGIEIDRVATIPRQVTLEYRLSRLDPAEANPEVVERMFEKFLRDLSDMDDDVGPPFHFVRVLPAGIRTRSLSGDAPA